MKARAWLGALISLGLLGLLVRYVEPRSVVLAMRSADPWLLAAAVLSHGVMLLLRVQRFAGLVGERGRWSRAAWDAVFLGWLANLTLPAKAGELVRPLSYGRGTGSPVATAVGAMVVERALDLLGLGALFGLALLFGLPEALPRWVQSAAWVAAAMAAAGMLGLALLLRFGRGESGLLADFRAGLGAVGGAGPLAAAVLWTAGIWALEVLGVQLTLSALGESPGLAAAAVLVVASTLAVAAPAGPAGLGVEQWVTVLVLVPFAVGEVSAVGASLLLLAAAVVWIGPIGAVAALRVGNLRRAAGSGDLEPAPGPELAE